MMIEAPQTAKLLDIQPLSKAAFSPYGDVIEAFPENRRLINDGTTERFHALTQAVTTCASHRVILSIFRGQPRKFPLQISSMERHPFGSQSFTPLSGLPFLVVVSGDENGKPGEPIVFSARPDQGVNYFANVWHHPLITLIAESDFLVVDRDDPATNLEEAVLSECCIIPPPDIMK